MKIRFTVFLLLSLILSVIGQPFPKGPYVGQPSLNNESVTVYWTESLALPNCRSFIAEFSESGQVKSMTFQGGSHDKGTSFEFTFPTDDQKTRFRDLKEWKKFAVKIHEEFMPVGGESYEIYAEREPFVLIAKSLALDNGEIPECNQALIFKKNDRYMSVTLDRWKGSVPQIGDSVIIGQNSRGEHYFQVKIVKVDYQYQIPPEIIKQLNPPKKKD